MSKKEEATIVKQQTIVNTDKQEITVKTVEEIF